MDLILKVDSTSSKPILLSSECVYPQDNKKLTSVPFIRVNFDLSSMKEKFPSPLIIEKEIELENVSFGLSGFSFSGSNFSYSSESGDFYQFMKIVYRPQLFLSFERSFRIEKGLQIFQSSLTKNLTALCYFPNDEQLTQLPLALNPFRKFPIEFLTQTVDEQKGNGTILFYQYFLNFNDQSSPKTVRFIKLELPNELDLASFVRQLLEESENFLFVNDELLETFLPNQKDDLKLKNFFLQRREDLSFPSILDSENSDSEGDIQDQPLSSDIFKSSYPINQNTKNFMSNQPEDDVDLYFYFFDGEDVKEIQKTEVQTVNSFDYFNFSKPQFIGIGTIENVNGVFGNGKKPEILNPPELNYLKGTYLNEFFYTGFVVDFNVLFNLPSDPEFGSIVSSNYLYLFVYSNNLSKIVVYKDRTEEFINDSTILQTLETLSNVEGLLVFRLDLQNKEFQIGVYYWDKTENDFKLLNGTFETIHSVSSLETVEITLSGKPKTEGVYITDVFCYDDYMQGNFLKATKTLKLAFTHAFQESS